MQFILTKISLSLILFIIFEFTNYLLLKIILKKLIDTLSLISL